MTIQSPLRSLVFLLATLTLLAATSATAQRRAAEIAPEDAVDESRVTEELQVDVKQAIDRDTDVADTALTFHNPGDTRAIVVCHAYGGNGDALGRKVAHVPANGLKYLRASDIAGGIDFVGTAVCRARTRIDASAVFLAPGALTNLNVRHHLKRHVMTIRFPLVATY